MLLCGEHSVNIIFGFVIRYFIEPFAVRRIAAVRKPAGNAVRAGVICGDGEFPIAEAIIQRAQIKAAVPDIDCRIGNILGRFASALFLNEPFAFETAPARNELSARMTEYTSDSGISFFSAAAATISTYSRG